MSTWHLPTAVTLTVALYIPSFHILASVDSNWQHIVGCADRYVIECFLGSNFDVRCLGDLFANESVMKYRLDRLCRARLGEPSEAIPPAVLFWFEAQLHIGLFCSRNRTSLRDLLERCFRHSPFSTYGFKGLFPEWSLTEDMHLLIGHRYFDELALVNARDMGCQHLGRSVNEVLTSLWFMRVGGCYCACHTEQCGVSFTAVCFNAESWKVPRLYRSVPAPRLCSVS